MKAVIQVCLLTVALTCITGAQESPKPPLRRGIHVNMPVASHAVEMPAADEKDATVLGITADGKLFLGAEPVEISALSSLKEGPVYLKADARAPYQKILTVLDALQGRSVVLLTAPAAKPESGKVVPPYGLKLAVAGQ